jgi:hypothetical protein
MEGGAGDAGRLSESRCAGGAGCLLSARPGEPAEESSRSCTGIATRRAACARKVGGDSFSEGKIGRCNSRDRSAQLFREHRTDHHRSPDRAGCRSAGCTRRFGSGATVLHGRANGIGSGAQHGPVGATPRTRRSPLCARSNRSQARYFTDDHANKRRARDREPARAVAARISRSLCAR